MASEKFIQLAVPCKECLVGPVCEDKKLIDKEVEQQNLYEFMLSLRKWDESKKCYRKGLIEAWVNMGVDIMNNMSSSEDNKLPGHATPGYLNSLIELANTLQWMIHSTSWRKGKMYDFDKAEVKKKLQQAIAWL